MISGAHMWCLRIFDFAASHGASTTCTALCVCMVVRVPAASIFVPVVHGTHFICVTKILTRVSTIGAMIHHHLAKGRRETAIVLRLGHRSIILHWNEHIGVLCLNPF